MGMFVLGLAVGCAGCAVVATVLFWVLGLNIAGGKKHKNTKDKE